MSLSQAAKIQEIGEWLGSDSLNFFGKPFAGKDYQADRLAKRFDVPVIGGGVILRNSVIPVDVQEKMDRGELIPSEDFEAIVVPYLSSEEHEGRPMILSSVGRVKGEEPGVIAATATAGHPIKAVPFLDITEAEAYRRLSETPDRGRADDTPEALKIRLEEFQVKTIPVLETYESMGLLVPIDAMGKKGIVFDGLVSALHERASAS